MSETDIQQLINAISTPNLVEKLMFAVTTLYLIATILVFLENKRMVKAAITASNISLFDKRLEILEKLQFKRAHRYASQKSHHRLAEERDRACKDAQHGQAAAQETSLPAGRAGGRVKHRYQPVRDVDGECGLIYHLADYML